MEENKKRKICLGAVISLIITLVALVLISLAIAVDTSNRIAVAEKSISDVNSNVNVLVDSLTSISQSPTSESYPSTEEAPSYTQEELISMAVSDDFSNMMEVALYPEATESHLLFIATACVYSDSVGGETSAIRLATALLDHPNATSAVASVLAQSKSRLVWLLVAQSELCSESTLAVIADKCVSASFGVSNDDPLVSVVCAICENDAVTENVLNIFEHSGNSYLRFISDAKLGKFPKP